jgi:excinuclease ABC subunit C
MSDSVTDTELNGTELIKNFVSRLQKKPGVYRMFDEHGNLLYVGKAKNLKNRVNAYTNYNRHPVRIQRMIRATYDMEFVICGSETEALLLEASLIKKLKPRYNILLRDDKSFPYILVRKDHSAAQIKKHRGAKKNNGDYYGPFASVSAVNRTLDTIQRAFRLRNCSDATFESRTRPCLLYQIKRCSAPCTGEINQKDYSQLIKDADDFLSGRSVALKKKLQKKMSEASCAQNYEKAAEYRDRIHAISQVSGIDNGINPKTFSEADIFAIHKDSNQSCVQVFFFRAGQNWGNKSYFPRHTLDDKSEEVLDAFIAQFYMNKPIPKNIYVNKELPNKFLLQSGLGERAGFKVSIHLPKRGEKKLMLDKAYNNAQQALARKMSESASHKALLVELKNTLKLERFPKRIEVYDNSHIQGTNAIGAFIVSGQSGFDKKEYRTFNIKDENMSPGDDYAMMAEVFRRRFIRLVNKPQLSWPDLILIDGGKGQLSIVSSVLKDLGVLDRITLVAIAKGPERNAGRETFFMNGRDPFTLPPKTPVLYYLQRLRDEAHRFAIGTHRSRRKKQMTTSPLDNIDGVGAMRKKALLSHFGSARATKSASLDELVQVEGISVKLAQEIFDHFND